jgi:hypothetical protein
MFGRQAPTMNQIARHQPPTKGHDESDVSTGLTQTMKITRLALIAGATVAGYHHAPGNRGGRPNIAVLIGASAGEQRRASVGVRGVLVHSCSTSVE